MLNSNLKALVGEEIEPIRKYPFFNTYDQFLEEILKEGVLSAKDKLLIFLGIYSSRGCISFAQDFLSNQIKHLNIKTEEILEILEPVVLSRGLIPLIDGIRLFDTPLNEEHFRMQETSEPIKSTAEILGYFKSRFKEIPAWIDTMNQRFPAILQHYHGMRNSALDGGRLPRKIKELVLVAVNAADLYPEGMKIHMNGALQSGASKEEIFETLLVSILGGGIVSWIDGVSVMKEIGIL